MRKHLKKFFIPHRHNKYNPHLFRNTSISVIVGFCVFLLGVSYGNYLFLHKTVLGINIATNVLVDLANDNRSQNNIKPLQRNERLDIAANMKASDMIEKDYFAHFAPDGTTPWYFIREAGYSFDYAGENLAINFSDPKEIDNAWMSSPTHKENLLNTNFQELGIAAKEGKYNGVDTVYVVQMFASPEKKMLASEETVTSQPEKLKVINKSNTFISVKKEVETTSLLESNTPEQIGEVAGVEVYSGWVDKTLFRGSYYIQVIFIFLIFVVFIGLLIRIFVEYEKQHYRHLIISIIFLLVVLVFAVINLSWINF
jgi:hypothetical protein